MRSAQFSLQTFLYLIGRLAIGAVAIFALQAVAADFYRWTDDKGVTHFSDKPPKGVNAEKVKTKTKRGPVEATDADVEEAQAKDPDAERCKAERERLSILQSNRRVQMQDNDGKVRDLTDKEIEEEIAFSRRAAERFCKP